MHVYKYFDTSSSELDDKLYDDNTRIKENDSTEVKVEYTWVVYATCGSLDLPEVRGI